jgi:hypothetical protein
MTHTEPVPTDELRQAIMTLFDYLWQEEREHFLTRQPADRAGQIFDALLVLARWLGQTNPSNGG